MKMRFPLMTLAVLFLMFPSGADGQIYYDTNGTTPGYGVYDAQVLDGSFWTATDGGTAATTDYATAGGTSTSTVVFSIDANSWTGNGQYITPGALTNFAVGGLDWRWVGPVGGQPNENNVGLDGDNQTLTFASGAVVDVEETSQRNDLTLTDWAVVGDFEKQGIGQVGMRNGTLNGTVTVTAGSFNLETGGDYSSDSHFAVGSGGSVNFFGAQDITVGGVSGSGTISNAGGSAGTNQTLTFSGADTYDFSGTLEDHPNATGIRNLAKTGSGTQVFSGALETEGTTTISNGTFAVDGTHTGAGAHSVTAGVLAGTGTIDTSGGLSPDADVTISGTGQVAPGRDGTIESLTLNLGTGTFDLTGIGSGALLFDLGATTDQIIVASGSTVAISNLEFSNFTFTELAGLSAGTYDLITSSNLTGSLGSSLTGAIGSNWTGQLQLDGNTIQLAVSVVPEPGTLALLLAAGVAGFFLVRRCRGVRG